MSETEASLAAEVEQAVRSACCVHDWELVERRDVHSVWRCRVPGCEARVSRVGREPPMVTGRKG